MTGLLMRAQWRSIACALLALLAGCGVGIAGAAVRVTIADLVFSPADITVKAGDTVEWVNNDFVDHTATAKNGAWDVMIPAGKSAHLKMTKVGTFTYFCRVHPDMVGTIRVTNN
ncbi:MAG TPA: cupredoxin domain-containing protein [Hyphomicrobium sp.]|nr:cupredoxin domain-containing protein [Hyphomicrobium sp.]